MNKKTLLGLAAAACLMAISAVPAAFTTAGPSKQPPPDLT